MKTAKTGLVKKKKESRNILRIKKKNASRNISRITKKISAL